MVTLRTPHAKNQPPRPKTVAYSYIDIIFLLCKVATRMEFIGITQKRQKLEKQIKNR